MITERMDKMEANQEARMKRMEENLAQLIKNLPNLIERSHTNSIKEVAVIS